MKVNIKKIGVVAGVVLIAPGVVFASTILDLIADLLEIVGALFPLLIAFAVLFLLWGLAQYVLKTDDVQGKEGARSMIIWGIIILFVMVSIWGFVNLLSTFFAFDYEAPNNLIDEIVTVPEP